MFLMLSMLGGLGAIAIPVIVHLLHRQKTTPVRWGAMQFLIESPLQQKRRRNIEHWLLLLARMAVLGLLAVALARPLLNSDLATPLGGGTSTDFAVVIDHSLSTGRAAGEGKTVFARSVELTDQIAGALKPGDTLAVVLAEHAPRALTERPIQAGTGDLAKVREALGQMKPGLTDANLAEAVQAAREAVNHGRGVHKKILVLSDEQKSGWQIDNATAWKLALGDGAGSVDHNVAVYDLPVAPDGKTSNLSIGALEIRPGVVGPNRPVEITASIAHAGSGDLPAVPVSLMVDGKLASSQTIQDLPAGSSRTVRFDHAFATPGSHWITMHAEVNDALAADNSASLAVNVLEKLPVLVIDGQLTGAGSFRASQFLRAALQPAEESQEATALIRPRVISVSDAQQAPLADYAAVIVNDVPSLPADVLSKLFDYAHGGHGVWFILGPRTQPKFVNDDLTRSGLFAAELASATIKGGNEPPGVAVKDPANRMVALLTASEKNTLTGVVATQWWTIKPTSPDARVVLAATSGEPLVIERPVGAAGGRIVVWATSVDGRWNTLPLAASFVPLVNETLLHLCGPSVGATYGRKVDAGKPLVWSGPISPPVLGAMITRPDTQAASPLKVTVEAGRSVTRYVDTYVPGLYAMRFTPSDVPQPVYFSVGIDPRELEPATLSPADLNWLKDNGFLQARLSPDKLGAIMAAPGSGSELWPTLAFAVVGMLVLETFMTARMIRLQAGALKRA